MVYQDLGWCRLTATFFWVAGMVYVCFYDTNMPWALTPYHYCPWSWVDLNSCFHNRDCFFCCVPNFRRRRVVVTWQTSHLDNHKDQKGSSGPLRYRREPRVLIIIDHYSPQKILYREETIGKPEKYAGNIIQNILCFHNVPQRWHRGDLVATGTWSQSRQKRWDKEMIFQFY